MIVTNLTEPVVIGEDLSIGTEAVVLIAGPCSVESYEQTRKIAEGIHRVGGRMMRGGAFKPRTSPHSFQGLGVEGLKILRAVADEFGLRIVTEALGVEHLPQVVEYADVIQIGSRNMQHYPLLWAAAETQKPILLKRGFMATIDEWLLAAEHIAMHGNEKIILCERGIRTFEKATRNTLDTSAIALVKQISPYPVICDPSHATGRTELVLPAARAAVASGADGLIVEVHPRPKEALSDPDQAFPLEAYPYFLDEIKKIAGAMGRDIV